MIPDNSTTISPVISTAVPAPALLLGYSGLAPFVLLSAALWFAGDGLVIDLHDALLLYAAIILSFMGAVHWGVAMAQADKPDARSLMLSVVPALVAWFASFISATAQLSVLYIAFAGLCVLDSASAKKGTMPAWYPKLRVPLTLIVILSLINAQLALLRL